jgi:6-pyruvoyltetrahydropterin/6-carboxytetrahydropterin synthase
MFKLVFSRRFAMGHRLIAGGSQKCAVPHGHNETVKVVMTPLSTSRLDGSANMVEPFERAKATWHSWIDNHVDHALQLSESDPLLEWFIRHEPHQLGRILVTPGDPTTELLACCMMAKINAILFADGNRLVCSEISIEETATNSLTFEGDPASALPESARRNPWWRRADMTINDLAAPHGEETPLLSVAAV